VEKYKLTKPQLQIYNMDRFVGSLASVICCDIFWNEKISSDMISSAVNTLVMLNDSLRIRVEEAKQEFAKYEQLKIERFAFDNYDEYKEFAVSFSKVELLNGLFEAKIIQLPNKSGLLVKLHHIISDGFSMSVMAKQLCSILCGKSPEYYSYKNFITKEEKYLNSERYKKDREYFLSLIKKTKDRFFVSNKSAVSFESKRYINVLDKDITKRIIEYARENSISEYGFFMSVLSICFYLHYNKSKKFFIGTTILNRIDKEELNTVGMFVNTIPVFIKIEENETIFSNIENIYYSILDAMKHQRCNFTDIQLEINKEERNLYDVLFSYHIDNIENHNATVNQYPPMRQAETLQIHIDDRQNSGCMNINYDYLKDKLSADDVCKLSNKVVYTIKAILKDDSLTPSELYSADSCLVLSGERKPLPKSDTFYHMFEKRATDNLNEICILGDGVNATYDEFLKAIYSVDDYVRNIASDSNCVVVICDRSFEMYSAIYGAVRAGCTIVPVLPEYPKERIEYIIRDCNAKAILCQTKYMHLFENEKIADISVLIANTNNAPEKILTTLSQTAYIIYTSGSTGNPKGVEISHLSLYNRLMWMQNSYPLDKNSVVLQKTPYTFDVSMWEIFWWGMYGAKLAFSNPGEHFIPKKIVNTVYKYKVSHIHFVPAVFSKFVEELEKNPNYISNLTSLKHIFLSGESAVAHDINSFYKLMCGHEVKIHNLYGPTECTIDVTAYECKKTETDPVPIGAPIFNTTAYVVDEDMHPVRDGQKGELLIGGVGVGKGYLNNPSLTNEKFVKNPFGEGMVYKTGDVVYINKENLITFVERNDSQVKINGQRIEIGEIESIINKHPKITGSIVMVENIENTDVLCAYYKGECCSKQELQKHCLNYFMQYMVPKYWYRIDEFPTNANGKCDRKALRKYKSNPCHDENIGGLPQKEEEILICNRFKKILNISYVDMDTDFFLSGGDSLNVIELMGYPEYNTVSMVEFMANPTPRGLLSIIHTDNNDCMLKTLHHSDGAKTSVILLPYGGGSAVAFAKLKQGIISKEKNVNIFYSDFLHSEDECKTLANQIKEAAKDTNIVIYSHCVGAAIALKVINILNLENVPVSKFVAGGIVLPKKSAKYRNNPWRKVPKFMIKVLLKKNGAPIDKASRYSNKFIDSFLKDTDFYFDYVKEEPVRVDCPTILVLSENDIFTMNYKGAAVLWSRYTSNIKDIVYLENVGHYFQNDAASELAQIILD